MTANDEYYEEDGNVDDDYQEADEKFNSLIRQLSYNDAGK